MMLLERDERFKDARKVYNPNGDQTIAQVAAATGVSTNVIWNLENNNEKNVGCLNVAALAKHYGVSADWLLCLRDLRTPDIDLQAICEYTGLSEDAVSYLHSLKMIEKNYPGMGSRLHLLSDLLAKRNEKKDREFDIFLAYLQNYVRLKTMPKPDVDAVNNAWGTIALDYLKSAGLIAALPDDLAKMEFDGRISDTLKKMLDEIAAERKAAFKGTDGTADGQKQK